VAIYQLNILVNKNHVGQSPYLIKCLERTKSSFINSKITSAPQHIFDFKPNATENQTKMRTSKSLHFNRSRMDTSSPIPPENNEVKHSLLCPSHSSSRLNAKSKITKSHSSNDSLLSDCSFTTRNKSVPSRESNNANNSSINHVQDDFLFQIGKHGRGKAEFMNPQAVCATHNRIYISDSNNQKIDVFSLNGEYKSSFDTNAGVKIMRRPVGIDWHSNGNILVVDYEYKCVNVFSEMGKFVGRICQNKLLGPKGICINRANRNQIIIADSKANSIFVFDADGRFLHKFGQLGYKNENFSGPQYVACMSNGDIVVTDFYNHCIKIFDANGKFKLSFGSNGSNNGQFNGPTGLVTDKNDNIIVVDWGNSRIQVSFILLKPFLKLMCNSLV
jgi:DNA-binding beta-propeller fold protein YncE